MQPSTTSKYKGSVLRKHQEQQVLPDELIAKKQSASQDESIRKYSISSLSPPYYNRPCYKHKNVYSMTE